MHSRAGASTFCTSRLGDNDIEFVIAMAPDREIGDMVVDHVHASGDGDGADGHDRGISNTRDAVIPGRVLHRQHERRRATPFEQPTMCGPARLAGCPKWPYHGAANLGGKVKCGRQDKSNDSRPQTRIPPAVRTRMT